MAVVDLACVVHVHSDFSDGTATVAEIIEAASATGADCVLLTDHDSMEAARQGWEGWHDELLLLVGHEITTRGGHLLAFGLERELDHRGRSEAEICDEVAARGGLAFAAHPFSRGGVVPSIIRPHPWRALNQCDGVGVELWSLVTDAAERWRTPLEPVRFLRDPLATLDGPPPESLAGWDRLCLRRRVPAVGGLDAHQTGLRLGRRVLSPMPHIRYFALLRTHVLLPDPPARDLATDRDAVYAALRAGRCYLAVDALAPGHGFEFFATSPDGTVADMGSEVPAGRWMLSVSLPRPGHVRLIRNGAPISEREAAAAYEWAVDEPGVYRVEARLSHRGRRRLWLVSNPIYARPECSRSDAC